MNQNTAGALLLAIIAAAGLLHDKPMAWVFAIVTAALAFLAAEVRAVDDYLLDWKTRVIAGNAIALASWATTLAAFAALFW